MSGSDFNVVSFIGVIEKHVFLPPLPLLNEVVMMRVNIHIYIIYIITDGTFNMSTSFQ